MRKAPYPSPAAASEAFDAGGRGREGERLNGAALAASWAGLLLASWGLVALLLWLVLSLARAL